MLHKHAWWYSVPNLWEKWLQLGCKCIRLLVTHTSFTTFNDDFWKKGNALSTYSRAALQLDTQHDTTKPVCCVMSTTPVISNFKENILMTHWQLTTRQKPVVWSRICGWRGSFRVHRSVTKPVHLGYYIAIVTYATNQFWAGYQKVLFLIENCSFKCLSCHNHCAFVYHSNTDWSKHYNYYFCPYFVGTP